jgi:hypothetical protein
MNILKNVLKVTMSLALLFLFSCTKEQNEPNLSSLTDEFKKVETAYKEGDYKIETTSGVNDSKVVTLASDEYKEKVQQILRKYSKQTTYLKNASDYVVHIVGVIKNLNGTCGPYTEYAIFMDCEDSRHNSYAYNWVGASNVDGNGNVTLRICMVNQDYFNNTTSNYAVLKLSTSDWQYSAFEGPNRIIAKIDNEDSGNANSTTINGVPIKPYNDPEGNFSYDTKLGFYNYPGRADGLAFPNLGIGYGVFGQIGPVANRGKIYLDDEDDNNANSLYTQLYNNSTHSLDPTQTRVYSVPGIIDQSTNTTLYMSKIMEN